MVTPASAGLPWLAEPLRRTLGGPSAHHALLVQGPAGVGQLEFALGLAGAWLCEQPRPLACGVCPSCHLVAQRSHPDLRLIVPQALRAEAGLPDDGTGTADEGSGGSGAMSRKPSTSPSSPAKKGAVCDRNCAAKRRPPSPTETRTGGCCGAAG